MLKIRSKNKTIRSGHFAMWMVTLRWFLDQLTEKKENKKNTKRFYKCSKDQSSKQSEINSWINLTDLKYIVNKKWKNKNFLGLKKKKNENMYTLREPSNAHDPDFRINACLAQYLLDEIYLFVRMCRINTKRKYLNILNEFDATMKWTYHLIIQRLI